MKKMFYAWVTVLLFMANSVNAQKTVTGKVTDAKNGAPVTNASVKVKGTNTGVATGTDGAYSLTLPKGINTLVFSCIGYEDQEIEVKGNSLDVSLAYAVKSLNEVVVVGYGTQIKREQTSSIARVKGAEVQNTPVPDMLAAIQGRAAGVFVEAQNGKVGEGIKVRVRGATSINGSNEPLYVVDGVPLTGGTFGSPTADINFNDVETFDILKDAAATSIYGSRGANGVVLITTKKGKNGKTRFTLNTQTGINRPTGKMEFMNAAEYIEFFKEAAVNTAKYHYNRAGNSRGYASEAAAIADMTTWIEGRFRRYSGFNDNWKTLATQTDWQELAFNDKAKTSQIELSMQGGNDKTRFFLSGSLNKQDGILTANKFARMGLRLNLDHQVNNWLKMGINSNLSKNVRNRVPLDNAFSTPMQIVALAPITPVRDANGALYNTPVTTYYNPLIDVEDANSRITGYRNQGNLFFESRIMNGLVLHNEVGLDMVNQNEDRFWGERTDAGRGIGGAGRIQWIRNIRWITNNYLNYNKTIANNHKVDGVLGMSYENRYDEYAVVNAQNYPDETIKTLSGATNVTAGSNTQDENNLISYFGRVNYTFKSKYLLGVSMRADGDSRFGTNNKYGYFPAVSAGWILSEENFLSNANWLSFLKLRGSYGISGNNSGLGYYSARSQYHSVIYGTGGGGLGISNFGNDDLRWEKTASTDIGLEFGIIKNRISGEVNWYKKNTTDMLLSVPVASTSGTTTVLGNIGSMENTGIEVTLNSTNVNTKDFRWTTSLNFARNRNKLTKLDGQQTEIIPADARYPNVLIVGESIGVFYAPKFVGADPANGDPLFLKQDGKTTTNQYGEAGKFIIGDPNPDWIGGITNNISYKGVELSFLFQGVFGNQVANGGGGFMSASADWFDNQTRDQLARWRKPGDVTMVPEARINRFGDFESPSISSRYVFDATYVRLKNVSLSYNVPQKWMNKLHLSNAKVYVTGVNLHTFTKYPGWDPEVNTDYRVSNVNQGGDFYAAPQIKSIVFGITVGL
ncbi:MAG: TonB-dependent receptor [Dinghuibacter sp.]|nr:TonB-dependent receptor [Dinghuibacter sp.]